MERTWKPTVAGILAIIAGAFQVIPGALCAAGIGFLGGLFGMGWLSAICAPLIVFGIIAIVGGICALRRRIWGLALAGSIFRAHQSSVYYYPWRTGYDICKLGQTRI
jgi:uncharacterized membrane protein